MILEIACFTVESALIAQRAGADRIEFCEDYLSGGVTPSLETIATVRNKISIPLFVMIRPSEGNFVYGESEYAKMKTDILACKKLGLEGVVFGILDNKNGVDRNRCSELVSLAQPLQTTFHRAFDVVQEPLPELENIISCGFNRLLTSGQKPNAAEGAELISTLIKKAADRIVILPGGGIRTGNISALAKKTGAKEFHSAALDTHTMLADEKEILGLKYALSKDI